MRRRSFLRLTGLTAFGIFGAACAANIEPVDLPDASSGDAGDAGDAHVRDALVADEARSDARAAAEQAMPARFTVRGAFTVLLNDTTCSGHYHTVQVSPATYATDEPVTFLQGSGPHELTFLPSELERLERGERVPFSTTGPGRGHGHCGLAWRTDVGGPDRTVRPACELRNPEAVCSERL